MLELVLIFLQAFQVLFLAIHDWVPLGRLNDTAAVRKEISVRGLVITTIVQTAFFAVGLFFSVRYFHQKYPGWLNRWLWITYLILFVGETQAWWIPYLLKRDPKRAERYQRMFGNTHTFLPVRNGIAPNTAHVLLHVATAATVVVLFLR
jgi:hypothetical protein